MNILLVGARRAVPVSDKPVAPTRNEDIRSLYQQPALAGCAFQIDEQGRRCGIGQGIGVCPKQKVRGLSMLSPYVMLTKLLNGYTLCCRGTACRARKYRIIRQSTAFPLHHTFGGFMKNYKMTVKKEKPFKLTNKSVNPCESRICNFESCQLCQ